MKILALYGSSYGQAEAVLHRVSQLLENRGHEVEVFSGKAVPTGLRVEGFDAVVIAASVILGRYQRYIRRFVREHLDTLGRMPTAFISVNGASPESTPEWRAAAESYVAGLREATGWRPGWSATFSGALRYTSYDFMTRWVMKKLSEKAGGPTDTSRDYEFTDWEAVDRFGALLAEQIEREAPQLVG